MSDAAAFAASEAIRGGEWDRHLPTLMIAVRDRMELLDHRKPPRRRPGMDAHQVWVWMNGPGTPHWEIRGTGAIPPPEYVRVLPKVDPDEALAYTIAGLRESGATDAADTLQRKADRRDRNK